DLLAQRFDIAGGYITVEIKNIKPLANVSLGAFPATFRRLFAGLFFFLLSLLLLLHFQLERGLVMNRPAHGIAHIVEFIVDARDMDRSAVDVQPPPAAAGG